MSLKVRIAHDPTCPWCWIGVSQADRLIQEFGVEVEWIGHELWPVELARPAGTPPPPPAPPVDRPKVPSRLELAYAAEGLTRPTAPRPRDMVVHNALAAIEHVKPSGRHHEFTRRIYDAYWLRGEDISLPETLGRLAEGIADDVPELHRALADQRHKPKVVPFDNESYDAGVYNVPTFFIGDERYAEQPYSVLADAVRRALAADTPPVGVYPYLTFPAAPAGRPWVFVNMVTTIDGKIVTGERDEHVMDLGSKTDHATMRQLQGAADAVLIGAGNLRATKGIWYPNHLSKFVLSASGDVPAESRFFTDAPDRAWVVTTSDGAGRAPAGLNTLVVADPVDWPALLATLRRKYGVERLLVEGGSELNAGVIRAGVVDELFLTLAPKLKLGRDVPTLAGGEALARPEVLTMDLVSCLPRGSEVFLRYRRRPDLS